MKDEIEQININKVENVEKWKNNYKDGNLNQ